MRPAGPISTIEGLKAAIYDRQIGMALTRPSSFIRFDMPSFPHLYANTSAVRYGPSNAMVFLLLLPV